MQTSGRSATDRPIAQRPVAGLEKADPARLKVNVDQFGEAIAHEITVGAEMAFDAGLNADMLKLAESGDLAKGMNHVAGFALLLRQVEFFVET
jgi:phage FluMu protein gp41